MKPPFPYGMRVLLFDNPYDEEWCRKIWEKGAPYDKYDRIIMDSDGIDKLISLYEDHPDFGSKLLEHPALPEFTMQIRDTEFDAVSTICFRKTAMDVRPLTAEKDGVLYTSTPFIDAYFHSEYSPAQTDAVINMGRHRIEMDSKHLNLSYSHIIYKNSRSRCDFDDPISQECVRNTKLAYMAIQCAMLHRPQVFVQSPLGVPQKRSGNGSGKGKKSARRVKIVKVIRLNPQELPVHTGRKMSCPSWGVMGHYRTYKKSGKRVWIAPYRKGRDRNKTETYQPKEYCFLEEEPDNA